MIKVWAAPLSKKDVLAKMNLLIQNLNYGNEAWKDGYVRRGSVVGVDEDKDSGIALNSGIGENYDEDDKLALKSDSRVAKLSDDILRSRIATFLLGDPSLVGGGHEDGHDIVGNSGAVLCSLHLLREANKMERHHSTIAARTINFRIIDVSLIMIDCNDICVLQYISSSICRLAHS